MKNANICAMAVAMLGFFSHAADAAVYNVNSDFGTSVFSYSDTSGALIPGTNMYTGYSGVSSDQAIPNFAYVTPNLTAGPITFGTVTDPTNTLWMDPEAFADVAVTFTAPTAANYTIAGSFLGIDDVGNLHGVEVLVGGVPVYTDTIIAGETDTIPTVTESLLAGQTITFLIESPGQSNSCDYCYLGTGLEATISSTPLPSTWTMLIAGFFGLGFIAYRGTKEFARHLLPIV